MSSNPNQSSSNSANRPDSRIVLPSFRELFAEYVVQDEQEHAQHASASRTTGEGTVYDSSHSTDLSRHTIPTSSSSDSRSHTNPYPPPSQGSTSATHSNRTPRHAGTPTPPPSQQRNLSSVLPSEEKKHICTICGKGFSSLMTHYNSHTGEKPFECPHPGCGSRFSVKSNMLRHYRTHTTAE